MSNDEGGFFAPELIKTLNRHGVQYVVIGAFAGVIMGGIARATQDIDICPARNPDNPIRLGAALKELQAKGWSETNPRGVELSFDVGRLKRIDMWNLTTRFGDLDVLFVPKGVEGYDELIREARAYEIEPQLNAMVVSLDDLIRTKRATDRPQDRADLEHLEALRELHAGRERMAESDSEIRLDEPQVEGPDEI